ncbi:MAG TPA: RNA polymerase sigma factor [Steroidobacteraceae bacterium]|nr:RNA polymerase sigma factor [Steroidobacteraceae bacterium]
MDDPISGLIRRAQGGDVGSFSELLDLHYGTIYRIAWKWCGHRSNAEDITQQSCIKLASSLAQYQFRAAFTSWLYQLVISCARDWQRAQQRHEHEALPADELTSDGSGRSEDYIYLVQLLDQLDEIGEGMKETALLVHAEGLSHAEAGQILGVSESTISWRIHAIRKHMNKAEALMSGGV